MRNKSKAEAKAKAFDTILEAARRLGKDGVVTIDWKGEYRGEGLWEVRTHKPGQGMGYLALQGTSEQIVADLVQGKRNGEGIWGNY